MVFLHDPFIISHLSISNRGFWVLKPGTMKLITGGEGRLNSDACLKVEMRCLLAVLSSLYNDVCGSCADFGNFPSIIDILIFYTIYWCHCVEFTQLHLLLLEHKCMGFLYTTDLYTSLCDMRLLGVRISLWKPTLGFHPNSPTSHSRHNRHSHGPTRLLHHRSLLSSNSSKTIVEEVPRKWGRCITLKVMKESRSVTVVPETVWLGINIGMNLLHIKLRYMIPVT